MLANYHYFADPRMTFSNMGVRLLLVTVIVVVGAFGLEDTWKQVPDDNDGDVITEPGPEVFIQTDPLDDFEWMKFKKTHNKSYENEWEEVDKRRNWADNVRFVNKHNEEFLRGEQTYWTAVQEYSDLSLEEFLKLRTGLVLPPDFDEEEYPPALEEDDVNAPSSVDWTSRGYVTPVKNQGSCGSCWAFSAVGAIESQTKKRRGTLPMLSEQQVLDCCDRRYHVYGCQGGWMNSAFSYVKDQGGIDSGSCYPYRARQGRCSYRASCKKSSDSGYVKVGRSESSLQQSVASAGPVSIAVDVNSRGFMNYRGGVFNNPYCNGRAPNHAMLCTGYGTYRGLQYWKVKNSWSTRWGDRGYVRMSRNRGNQCGIGSFASYPRM